MSLALTDDLLYRGSEWDFDAIRRAYDAIEEIARDDLGLDVYANQIEIISSEQMLDAYASNAMPLMYQHWSFGKRFARDELVYRKGLQGLAYEVVINSDPCIAYLMEENTMTMQALVMAHACFGHNHFFKNNYLFQLWTDAGSCLDYLEFAKKFLARCEDEFGVERVERVLDSAHALMDQGVFRYPRRPQPSKAKREERIRRRVVYDQETFNDLWRTLPEFQRTRSDDPDEDALRVGQIQMPEENLLYFLEKASPILEPWEREILRIVRNVSQYFYPQKQTKVMNEGCATFTHYYIMTELHARGRIDDGALLEAMHAHANVVFQPDFDDPRYSGINPYALGFAVMQDIKRMVTEPDDEDRLLFPDFAGSGDWRGALRHAWANFRDESFLLQFLSPRVVRDFHLFALDDDERAAHYTVSAIHDERGFQRLREALAAQYDLAALEPEIEVAAADMKGDRKLVLQFRRRGGMELETEMKRRTLSHVERLWGYDVALETVSADD